MFRFRNLFLGLGGGIVLAALFVTDPDGGGSTALMLLGMAVCVLAVAFAHVSRKALTDYPEADMRKLFRIAGGSSVGAGLALIALSIVISALLGLFGQRVHAATPPPLVYVGDSIAVGLAQAARQSGAQAPQSAAVGHTTAKAIKALQPGVVGARVAVVSVGTNDAPLNPVILANLRRAIGATQYIWIAPFDDSKAAVVTSHARTYKDTVLQLKNFAIAKDQIHPSDYVALHEAVTKHLRSTRFKIPAAAHSHLPQLRAEQTAHWPDHPSPATLAALIEHESCISLSHERCWSPTSRLRSQREEGAGLGQLTRAWRPDGSLRFDALADMRERHPELRALAWSTIYQRPDLQLRALVLMSRDNYRHMARLVDDPQAVLAFADAAYNGGMAGVQSDRRACQIKAGCNPDKWFDHVEHTCTKSRAALYGQRSACDINRHHVADVLLVRTDKYRPYLET